MSVQRWCAVGATVLLLVCQVAVSQLCHSLILLVDGYHTLYVLVHLARSAVSRGRGQPAPSRPPPGSPAPPPRALPTSATPSPDPGPAEGPPRPLGCGVSYTGCRVQVVGDFLAALFLASLCISGVLEIIGLFMGPKPVRRHLLLVAVSGGGLLHKTLLLWWSWGRERDGQSPLRHKAREQAHGQIDPAGENQRSSVQAQPAAGDVLHNGVLVLCNPAASGLADADPENLKSHVGDLASPLTSRPLSSLHLPDRARCEHRWPRSLLSLALVLQMLGSALLALAHSLVVLTASGGCERAPGACASLQLQDPSLSSLAVVMLTAAAMLQVRRYGLLLLQAVPPGVCVSHLSRRIRSVPGVRAVHDLHIWQLSESVTVASVHVHCHAEFGAHRCADLMSGVTKVLQSVGVNCCTVQPEFAACYNSPSCPSPAGADAVDLGGRCLLACSKSCAGFMCCSSLQEETQTLSSLAAQETMEEPQTLIMANNFTEGK